MKNYYYAFTYAVLTIGLISCSGKETENTEETTVQEEKPMEMVDAVSIWDGISVREEPSSDGKWVSSISLGEKIKLTGNSAVDSSEKNREYVQIKLGDDKQGWVVSDFVEAGTAVTAVKEVQIYKRPDLLTKTDNSFKAMDVMALIDTRDEWVEVKGKSQDEKWFWSGWVKRSNLSDNEVDIAVAVYAQKALEIEDEDERIDAIQEIIENDSFTSSQFMVDLKDELNELQNEEEKLIDDSKEGTDSVKVQDEVVEVEESISE